MKNILYNNILVKLGDNIIYMRCNQQRLIKICTDEHWLFYFESKNKPIFKKL